MKRNTKPFSVEIKKPRIQGQRHQLPPRRLFASTPVETNNVFEKEEPPAASASPPAPRILPSIVEPVWSSSEPPETARRKRRSAETDLRQVEFNLDARASEDVADALAEAPVSAEAMPQVDDALDDSEDMGGVYPVQSAQGEGVRVNSRRPRKKASGTVEQEIASEPTPEAAASALITESSANQRRIKRRLAAAAQLPRHERWKGRLHPAAW